MTKPSLIFTEQFFFPEGWGGAQLPRDITIHLAESGFDVDVVCGSEIYAPIHGDAGQDPRAYGVSIIRLPRLLRGDIHSHKLVRQLWFYLLAVPVLLLRSRPDLYVTQTNPPLLVPIVAAVACVRGVPMMIIAQDLYPEVVIAHGMLRGDSFAAHSLKRLFGWAYKRAAGVAALGPVMAERLVEKGVRPERVSVISNWATGPEEVVRGPENALRKEWQLDGKFVLLYSGNLGVAHDIETTVEALTQVIKVRPEVRLVIIGKGTRIEEARVLVQKHGIADVVLFKPLVPAHLLPHSLGLADLALVTLGESFSGLVVPSKLLGYMARRIPTVYVGPPSDVSTMLAQSGGGLSFRNADVRGLAQALGRLAADHEALSAMGAAAAQYYGENFARSVALRRYADLIGSLSRENRSVAQGFARS